MVVRQRANWFASQSRKKFSGWDLDGGRVRLVQLVIATGWDSEFSYTVDDLMLPYPCNEIVGNSKMM